MHFKAGKPLNDIRRRCEFLVDIKDSVTLDEFKAQLTPLTLAERHLEVVGEAAGRLKRLDPRTAHRVAAVDEAIGLRNLVAHGYDDEEIVERLWTFMLDDVPPLLVQVNELLREYHETYGLNPDFDVE